MIRFGPPLTCILCLGQSCEPPERVTREPNFRKLPAVLTPDKQEEVVPDGLGADGDGLLRELVEGDALLVKYPSKNPLEVLDESVKASASLPTATIIVKYCVIFR